MKIAIKVIKTVFLVVLSVLLVINGWFLTSKYIFKNEPGHILGYSVYSVSGNSMYPTLNEGDAILSKSHETYLVGDVVTYRIDDSGKVAINRIVGTHSGGFITRPDSNVEEDDELLQESAIVGKVEYSLPFLGGFCSVLQSFFGTAIIVLAMVILVVLPSILMKNEELGEEEREEEEMERRHSSDGGHREAPGRPGVSRHSSSGHAPQGHTSSGHRVSKEADEGISETKEVPRRAAPQRTEKPEEKPAAKKASSDGKYTPRRYK